MNLSKSKYCEAVRCPKMLWLSQYKPEVCVDSAMNQSVLTTGLVVGDLAMRLFGGYTEVPYDSDLKNMLEKTGELLAAGTEIIAEASFAYEGCFCSVDILRNLGGNEVELYEVKSANKDSELYHHDIAYQTWILTKLGFQVSSACLVHLNSDYVKDGALNLAKLFSVVDLTEAVETMLPQVEENVKLIARYMAQTEEPEEELNASCFKPYPCLFYPYCSRMLPRPNVFDLSGPQLGTKLKLYRSGYVSFAQLRDASTLQSNGKAMEQILFTLEQRPPKIKKDEIRALLAQLSYPLYFLDFETFQPAIPLYDGTHPYQQIPFQYSLHYIEYRDGPLLHREFLAQPGEDPRRALAEQLVQDIPMDVCTTAYNMSFEKTRLKELADVYPDLAEHLMNIHDHIVDLMTPFQSRAYYTEAMQGSYSIKYVLPALCPDDPTLDYHNLAQIHNGSEASAAFELMACMTPVEQAETRANLLKYCGLDTYAMVKVWEKLKEAAE